MDTIYCSENSGSLRMHGTTLLAMASDLNRKIDEQLLKPLSRWVDDPDFMQRHSAGMGGKVNWAKLKRDQRRLSKRQRILAAERLSLYRERIQVERDRRKRISAILNESKSRSHPSPGTGQMSPMNTTDILPLAALVFPFSMAGHEKATCERAFHHARQKRASSLLPYRAFLATDVGSRPVMFRELPDYAPNRRDDRINKFQTLLQLASEGAVGLQQESHKGSITILPSQALPSNRETLSEFLVQRLDGKIVPMLWTKLSDIARQDLIRDALACRIICRA